MATIAKHSAVRLLDVLKARVGVNVAGEGWQELVGASLVSHDAGSRSVSQVPTFRGVGASVGAKTVEPVSFDLGAPAPNMKHMLDLGRADRERLNVQVRMDVYGGQLQPAAASAAVGGVTLAVPGAAPADIKGGVVTFVDASTGAEYKQAAMNLRFWNDEILRGDVIRIGSTNYVINLVEIDDTKTGAGAIEAVYLTNEDGSAVAEIAAAAAYSIREPGARWQFNAEVQQFGSISGDASGGPNISSGVVFQPKALLADPILLTDGEGEGLGAW